jgi:hypothetical protein
VVTVTIQERIERALRATAYFSTGCAGLAVFLLPPAPTISVLGYTLSGMWAAFMLSAFPAAWGALRGRYRVEYVMLPFFGMAMVLAATSAWIRAGQDAGITARACLLTALLLCFAARFAGLHLLVSGEVRRWTPK